jgi:2-polyprenyl-3-methyl-5-hydroxy-6-metoxy-1,4-benzoquinol methylase
VACKEFDALQLKHNLQPVPCNLCGTWEAVQLYAERDGIADLDANDLFACTSSAYGHCGPIVRCVACGLVRQNPQPQPEDLVQAYQEVADERYEEEASGRVETFRLALRDISRHESGGRLLDVGCHTGIFLDVARQAGWETYGVEPSRWSAERARARGLKVVDRTLAEAGFREGSFDVITMWDVIEHLAQPKEELQRAARLLRPGGLLALSTMNVESWFPRLLRRRWPWYMQMHLYYFSPRTLRQMLAQTGFEMVETVPHRRIVRLSYLVSRLEAYCKPLERLLAWGVAKAGQSDRLVAVDLGDIFVTFARKTGG